MKPRSQPISITVVIPSFNQGRFIDETIQSLVEQEYPALEIIVMDGGSSDDTVSRLEQWGQQVSWQSGPDGGQSDAICKGFANATGEWLTWLNSDDTQCNRALWEIDAVAARKPEIEVIVGQAHYMDEDGRNPRPYPTIETGREDDVLKELFEKGYLAQPSVFFKKSIYARIGGINSGLKFCMDYDLWVRFAIAGARFAPCNVDISGNRWYETTKSSGQTLALLSEVTGAQTRHFGKVSPFFVQALSDNLYQQFHSNQHGDFHHILYRTLYFKTVWLWFNVRRPLYCIKGLFAESIAKSGPIVGDKLTWQDVWSGVVKLTRRRLIR